MNSSIDLCLLLVRLAQGALGPRSSMLDWDLVPDGRILSWPEARLSLGAHPTPVVVAPLLEPGSMSLWSVPAMAEEQRCYWQSQIANQQSFYAEQIQHLRLAESDPVSVELPAGQYTVTVEAFRQWAAAYVVATVGVGLIRGPDRKSGRLIIRVPGGCAPPLGDLDGGRRH